MRLQSKFLVLCVAPALLLGPALLWTVKSVAHKILLQDVEQRGLVAAADLAAGTKAGFEARSEQVLLPLLQQTQDRSGAVSVMALSPSGEVLAHTNVAEKGNVYHDAISVEALKTDSPIARLSTFEDVPILRTCSPVWASQNSGTAEEFLLGGVKETTERTRLGTVCLSLSLQDALQTEYRLFRKIAAMVLIAGFIGLSSILFFMRQLLRPIRFLSEGTSRISRGEYGVNVPVFSKDELGTLAQDFNRMSEALKDTTVSKDFMSNVLDNLLDPLLVLAPDTTVQVLNPAAAKLLGYQTDEILGKPIRVLAPRGIDLFREEQENDLRKATLKNVELNLAAKDGSLVSVLFSSTVIKDSAGGVTHIIAVAKDMTERKKLEIQLLQTGKLSAVGQLAGGVAHEINNPLGVILGFAQGMLRRVKPGDVFEMPLKAVEREAIRCKNLVQDLLTFSRSSKADREPMDLNQAIEGALSLVMAQARLGQIQVQKDLAPNLPRILGNPNQVQQVIINLANNALDAMGKQGTLTLRTESLDTAPRSWVCLYVTDSGFGISPDILPRIFEPFFTTKPIGQGTGLGLGLVHEIVQKHSGTVDVQSRPGHTEFCVKFPVRLSQGTAVVRQIAR